MISGIHSSYLRRICDYISKISKLRRHYSTNEISERFSLRLASVDNEQRRFEYENQQILGVTTLPENAPTSAKEIAVSKPWDGNESPVDGSKRMLEDSYKPLKIPRSQRLSNARENVLDYKLNKDKGPTFKERLIANQPGSTARNPTNRMSSGLSSGGWIESTAASTIENAIASGQFEGIPRGEKAFDSRKALIASSKNPQLDFTEYLMNNIIKKQGGAPPWIMKHTAVRERVSAFREQIRRRLQERLVHRLTELAKNDIDTAIELAHSRKHNLDHEWETNYESFHSESIESINRQIRGYNLQAPSTARKGYLNIRDEIQRCYETVNIGIENEITKYVGKVSVPKAKVKELHSSLPPLESPEKHYGLAQLLKDLLFRKKE